MVKRHMEDAGAASRNGDTMEKIEPDAQLLPMQRPQEWDEVGYHAPYSSHDGHRSKVKAAELARTVTEKQG